jgi:inositol phosphorylceramide mannosyltransferase catalytic subunit
MMFIILLILFISLIISHFLTKNKYENYIFPKFKIDNEIILPTIKRENIIPKIIYRTHIDIEKIKPYQKVLDKTKEILPDYETKIYYNKDVKEYIKNNFSERIYNAYNSINDDFGPAKADFFRYLIIYKEGGIYLDIKSGPIKNIDNIIEKLNGKLAISNWTNLPLKLLPILYFDELYFSPFLNNLYGEYQNWYIISGKGNPLLAEIIKQMITNIEEGIKDKNIYSYGRTSVIALTGPLMFSKIIENYKNKEDFQIFNPNLDNHLKYKIVDHIKIEKEKYYRKIKNKYVL